MRRSGFAYGKIADFGGLFIQGGPPQELKTLLKKPGESSKSLIVRLDMVETVPKFRWSTRLNRWIPIPPRKNRL